MLLRRGLLAVFIGLGLALFTLPAQGTAGDFSAGAHKFVRELADKAIEVLAGEKITEKQRTKNFRRLFREYFDIGVIGRHVLGRHWRKATRGERDEFLSLFENLIVTTYIKRFRKYTNESLIISGATSRNQRMAIVHSRILRGSGTPAIRVDWRVDFPDGAYKVTDLVVEGVSMVQTQRSEFSSVIRRNGGKVEGLIIALRQKKFDMGEDRN